MRKIKTVILCAGGYGTRFLPFTKSLPKEMLPVGGVPAIQLVVEECINAGFQKIVIVIRKGSDVIKNHFKENKILENHLKSKGDLGKLNLIKNIPEYTKLIFVEERDLPYGNIAPILSTNHYLNDEYIGVAFADDVIIKGTGIKELKDIFESNHYDGIVSAKKIDRENIPSFGNVYMKKDNVLKKIIQKPKLEEVKSDLAMVSRLIIPTCILKDIKFYNEEPDLGVTISYHAKSKQFLVKEIQGDWLNLDNPFSYYEANKKYFDRGD